MTARMKRAAEGAEPGFLSRLEAVRHAIVGDYVAVIVASEFVDWMSDRRPAELIEWMRANAVRAATETFTQKVREERTRAIRDATTRNFAQAARNGDAKRLGIFSRIEFVIDDKDTRRHLGRMTGPDCGFVAADREATGQFDLSVAAFLRALERKAGVRTIDSVMSEAECERLMGSLLGGSGSVALAA